jgi:hypothetical protein
MNDYFMYLLMRLKPFPSGLQKALKGALVTQNCLRYKKIVHNLYVYIIIEKPLPGEQRLF